MRRIFITFENEDGFVCGLDLTFKKDCSDSDIDNLCYYLADKVYNNEVWFSWKESDE